jgi:hypothetical protein
MVAPRRNILQLVNPYSEGLQHVTMEVDTNLVVRSLITPVVVWYCFASANTPTIPERQEELEHKTARDFCFTYSSVKVGHH